LTNQEIARAVLMYRARNNLTQVEMAEKAHVSPLSIARAEKGGDSLRDITIAKLEVFLRENELHTD
jgi:DNA-binding XRE family transcriptional regulator